jgi:hypothetical protein
MFVTLVTKFSGLVLLSSEYFFRSMLIRAHIEGYVKKYFQRVEGLNRWKVTGIQEKAWKRGVSD